MTQDTHHDAAWLDKPAPDTPNNSSPGEAFLNRRLYVEFRVYFDPSTNQTLLDEMAQVAQERIYDMFEGITNDHTSGPLPTPLNVTYQLTLDMTGGKEDEHNG